MTVQQEMKTLTHFIKGEEVAGTSNRFSEVFNPSTGEVIARVPLASRDEVKHAIQLAKEAFPAWKKHQLGSG